MFTRAIRAVSVVRPLTATVTPIVSRVPIAVAVVPTVRSIHSSVAVRSGAGIAQHRPSAENNLQTPFEFSAANKEKIKAILAKYPPQYKQSAVMPLLQMAQEQNNNWLPLTAMNKIAETLDMAPIRVYEVATFYSMYNRTPMGKYHIQLCGTTPCQLCGAEQIGEAILKHLNIKMGETTPDGLFTVTEVECLGACVNAPMIQVNNHEFYENLTPENVVKLIDGFRAGGFAAVKVGPQTAQKNCEGPQGKTSLFTDPTPVCRDLDALKASIAAAKPAAAPGAPATPAPAAPAPPTPAAAAPKPAAAPVTPPTPTPAAQPKPTPAAAQPQPAAKKPANKKK